MNSRASKKSLPAAIGGLILVAIAGYFGLDLGGNSGGSTSSPSTEQIHTSPTPSVNEGARTDSPSTSGLATCEMSSLPAQADEVVGDILAGGPFAHPDRDGTRFGNYEGVLPQQSRNFYREYTVDTPGLNHRGERRIVTGGGSETDPDVWYYTDDHYESFCEIPDAEH